MFKKIFAVFGIGIATLMLPVLAFASEPPMDEPMQKPEAEAIHTAQVSETGVVSPLGTLEYVAIGIFVIGYLFITMEHKFSVHKSAIALLLASILWVLASVSGADHHTLEVLLHEAGGEVFEIIIFLLAAMSLVEILVHYQFFDIIRLKLMKLKLKDRPQFLIIAYLTFFLSAVLDNMTITIVMIQIARRFFKGKNLLIAAAGVVIMANAGGAWSPLGDVTTIMIWLAKKFTTFEIISQGLIPSLVLGTVSTALIVRQMSDDTKDLEEEKSITLTRGEKLVIGLSLASFSLPLIMHSFGLRPYMGLLLGLGLVWSVIEILKVRSNLVTHLEANIEHILQKSDIASLKFFIGILLAVSALNVMGVLEHLSLIAFGVTQEFNRVVIGNVFIGLFSAVVDNVPLTALSLDVITLADPHVWVLLALAVGTGGSFLIIGSVAGVIAMGMVKELSFEKYFRIAALPALLGYIAGMITWYVQYLLIT
ncbi:hypothetical protein C4579_00665 [Candidatus Microgenomates bacterium]|nr:MAG: hypothetical protein C4579_00665 [Candidatus Microgenomates bacterium]